MSNELATRTDTTPAQQAMTLPQKMEYAKALASASLLPRSYQQQPGNVLLAMELGDALGIPPIQAINDVHVIEGKPSASANLIGAMVRKAGHKLRVNGDDTYATAQVIRADDPDFTFEVTWTLDRAKTAGLLSGKGNWSKYPAAMLKARAITEVARSACPDALYGVVYTPEELGAVVTEEGTPVANPNPAPARQQPAPTPSAGGSRIAQARARSQAKGTAPSAPSQAEAPAPEPESPAEAMCSPEQWQAILAAMTEQGITDGAAQHAAVVDTIGRNIDQPWDMTAAEAEKVIAAFDPTVAAEEPVQGELVDEQA
ncbi:MAG: hypothetical protein QJR09_08015 [Micrococcus sp.]|nr:hypothetical protein [Micrococcus sp.]